MITTILGVSPRQQLIAGSVVVVGLLAAVSAAFGQWRLAGVAAIAVLTAGVLVMLDLRRRAGVLDRRLQSVGVAAGASFTSPKLRGKKAGDNAAILDAVRSARTELKTVIEAREAERSAPAGAGVMSINENRFGKHVSHLVKNQTREVEALLQLYGRVRPADQMPLSGQWALNPQGLLSLYMLVERNRPKVVVEFGSGTSTVWLGYAIAANGPGRLVSIDHDGTYARQTEAMVALHESAVAPTEVRHAPLISVALGEEEYRWYDPAVLDDVRDIDLLIIDGPPSKTGPLARFPAVPALADRLADGAVVVLDDASRSDERRIIRRWMDEIPGLVPEASMAGRQAVLRYHAGQVN